MLTTTLRSRPCGRGGASGTSPAAMRSVQSAYMAIPRGPNPASMAAMPVPICPDFTRRSQAATEEWNVPRLLGISRVALVPIVWHAPQRIWLSQSAWLFIRSEMPLPLAPVPGNSLLSGTFASAYQ